MSSQSEFDGPGWDILTSELRARAKRSGNRDWITAEFTPEMRRLVQHAARFRGMSQRAYVRRAVMAVVCHDLEMDWGQVMADEPAVLAYEDAGAGYRRSDRARGLGWGPWRISEMEGPDVDTDS